MTLRQNRAKNNLNEGKIVSVPMGPLNGDLIEHFGPLGFDAIWLEGEHGPVDFNNIPDLTRACDLWNMTPIVRVHQNEPATIYRTFDLGAQGITVPHVNTKKEALSVVDSGKFAPLGHRGSFTSRQGIGVKNYYSQANDPTMLIILIEDIVAVNNLDEILEVENIDVFFVAPGDLAQTMGYPGEAGRTEVKKVVAEAIKKDGGPDAVSLRVAEQYVNQFGNLAKENNTMIIPSNLGDISSVIATAMSVIDQSKK